MAKVGCSKHLGNLALSIHLMKGDLDIWERALLMASLSLFLTWMGLYRLRCCLSLCEPSEESVSILMEGILLLPCHLHSGSELEPKLAVRLLLRRFLWFCLIHLHKWFTSHLRPTVSFERWLHWLGRAGLKLLDSNLAISRSRFQVYKLVLSLKMRTYGSFPTGHPLAFSLKVCRLSEVPTNDTNCKCQKWVDAIQWICRYENLNQIT